jgi:hypothetical protein
VTTVFEATTADPRLIGLRARAGAAVDELTSYLDNRDHDEDCVLRCLVQNCDDQHGCPRCQEEVQS